MSFAIFGVHSRQQAISLRKLCPQIELLVPRHVAITGGPAFVHAFCNGLEPPPWIDIADQRGHALGLIRLRVSRLVFDGPTDIFDKLADMGRQNGVLVVRSLAHRVKMLKPFELADKVLAVRLQEEGFEPRMP